ncbi:hypothetical protein ScPMuIL_010526 [Solemya velum]
MRMKYVLEALVVLVVASIQMEQSGRALGKTLGNLNIMGIGGSTSGFAPHIIGGYNAQIKDYPFVCYLEYRSYFICTCTIMRPRKVLTAAHCLTHIRHQSQLRYLNVIVGLENVQNKEEELASGLARRYTVKTIKNHPNYTVNPSDNAIHVNDIAGIELTKQINSKQFNGRVKPMWKLAKEKDYTDSVECYIFGYGATGLEVEEQNGEQYTTLTFPTQLQEANVPIQSRSVCEDEYGVSLRKSQICAFENEGGVAACSGDSGGPLACKHGNIWRLLGICSYGYEDCSFGTVYTDARYFRTWLNAQPNGDDDFRIRC